MLMPPRLPGYGKKIYPDWFVADIVRRMHENHALSSVGLYKQLVEEGVISPEFSEWQISSFVHSNPRFRSRFISAYGEEAHRTWKSRFRRPDLSWGKDPRPPMDFSGFHPLAVRLAVHTHVGRRTEEEESEEGEDEETEP